MLLRNVYSKLTLWSNSKHRKPLVLQGARQVGKTHALAWLGQSHYENTAYLNFEKDTRLRSLFAETLEPRSLIAKISTYIGKKIMPSTTLLIFDEIQECNEALNSLKYFCEEAPEYHVAAAGSLLGVKMSKGRSFPVGKVDFLNIFPLNFDEFLDANRNPNLRQVLDEKVDFEPLADAFHQRLLEQLTLYLIVGGMPEVVARFSESSDVLEARRIQESIITAYQSDFSKHAPANDIPKILRIWESIPRYLSLENKRFVFSALRKGARGRDYESALTWLKNAGLIHFCHRISKAALPLRSYANSEIFKIYALDVGLLGALANLPCEVLYQGSKVFHEFHGAFIENYVAQEFVAAGADLHYWESDGQAEIDFVCQDSTTVFPVEAKAGINVKSKSLKSFRDKHPDLKRYCRTNLLNFQQAGDLENYPLYAVNRCLLRG